MKMLRLALVLPAFVLLLAAGGAARAETFFASLEKKPSSGAERPASRPESGSPSTQRNPTTLAAGTPASATQPTENGVSRHRCGQGETMIPGLSRAFRV